MANSGGPVPAPAGRSRSTRRSPRTPAWLERGRESQAAHESCPAPIPRAGHVEAVALYEAGRGRASGARLLARIDPPALGLSRYPEERELHERVRLYLNVCDRHMAPRAASPSTPRSASSPRRWPSMPAIYDEALDALASRHAEVAGARPRALHARVGPRAARRGGRGRAAASARHRAESRQPGAWPATTPTSSALRAITTASAHALEAASHSPQVRAAARRRRRHGQR